MLNRESALRLIKDIRNLKKNPLHDNGIYYEHDEENMLLGRAMIIGPSETPYQYGFYFFKFEFNDNYPHQPPKLTYYTQSENIRFHPNLYRSGKVCVSILNTWRGEQWSSCQTISTILLTLTSLLHSKPLLNEPGITENHFDFEKYNEIIKYKNFECAIIDVFKNLKTKYSDFICFEKDIICNLTNNLNNVLEILKQIVKENEEIKIIKTNLYTMTVEINYKQVLKQINKIKKKFIRFKN